MALLIFEIVLFSAVIFCDVLLAVLCLKKRTTRGRSLGLACLSAAVVTTSYLISVFTEAYFWYSVFSSIYFIGIDFSLMALLYFVRSFVKSGKPRILESNAAHYLLSVWVFIDTVLLALNPFVELSIHYTYIDTTFSHYVYDMKFPYQMHLVLSYVILGVVIFYLARKAMTVPSVYRRQYHYSLLTLVLVILINAAYLYLPIYDGHHMLDYSLLGYSLAGALFYWISFSYAEHGMMDLLRNYMFANMGSGFLLFDYEDNLILQNQKAGEMLSGYMGGRESAPAIEDMARLLNLDVAALHALGADKQRHTFRCYPASGGILRPLTCNYCILAGGRKDEALGKLFVFSELTSEYDALTGFGMFDAYKKHEAQRGVCPVIVTAAACDINALADINAASGQSGGDQAIQTLARLMLKHFPRGTVFLRGSEATLAAVCDGADEKTVLACVNAMHAELAAEKEVPFEFTSGIFTQDAGHMRSEAVMEAAETLRMRKLLDERTRHSEVLYSMVRMLQACDNDTEAHVRRTQKMCAKLGVRIGLTQEQQSNLALLALLHDIGKTGIPLDILNKPGKLTAAEWRVLMTHTEKGYRIANSSPELRGIADMILYHHERWDGKGYPDGLSKETIPLLSRVIAIVDSYDAMINDRPYRKALSKDEAAQEIKRCAGSQFDPAIAAEFLHLLVEVGDIDTLPDAEPESKAASEAASPGQDAPQRSLEAQEGEEGETPRVHIMRTARYTIGNKEQDYRIKQIDEAFTDFTGYTQQDIEEKELTQLDLIFKADRDVYLRIAGEGLARDAMVNLEHWIRRKDGSAEYVFCCGRKFYNSAEREEQIEVVITDSASSYSVQTVVQREYDKATRRLERWENKFRRDALTGLLNHEAFKNDIEARLMAGNSNLMMLMMDVDRFKAYNDTYGHRAGDEFLVMVAQTLLGALRKDDFACRMGGDEFAAVLFFDENATHEQMAQRAAQIFDKINLTLTSISKGGTSLSMGAAFSSKECYTFNSVYEAADHALYRSKENGRAKLSF